MCDYRDFNIQHTLPVLSLHYSTIARALRQAPAVHEDLIEVANWVSKAQLNQFVHSGDPHKNSLTYRVIHEGRDAEGHRYEVRLPNENGGRRVTQGLFSGSRGTTFDNTCLNLAYLKVAHAQVELEFGAQALDLKHVHTGDDVWLTNASSGWNALVTWTLANSGLVFQPSKQKVSPDGEFLRVIYSRDSFTDTWSARSWAG